MGHQSGVLAGLLHQSFDFAGDGADLAQGVALKAVVVHPPTWARAARKVRMDSATCGSARSAPAPKRVTE